MNFVLALPFEVSYREEMVSQSGFVDPGARSGQGRRRTGLLVEVCRETTPRPGWGGPPRGVAIMRMALTCATLVAALLFTSGTIGQEKQKQDPTKKAGGDKTKPKRYKVQDLEGKDAPEFKPVFAINGDTANLEKLKGKVVFIDFWAVWCGPCRAVFPQLTEMHKDYKDKGLELIGLTTYYQQYEFKDGKLGKAAEKLNKQQEHDMLKSFVKHFELPYRIEVVERGDFSKYNIEAIPSAVLIDRKGKVRMVKIGASKDDAPLRKKIEQLLEEKP